jgi:chorismate mutase
MTGRLPEGVDELRRRIDALDRELVRTLNQRSRCALEIGRLKRSAGIPIHDPEREHEILMDILRTSKGPLTDEALERLFERILGESRRLLRSAATGPTAAPGAKRRTLGATRGAEGQAQR